VRQVGHLLNLFGSFNFSFTQKDPRLDEGSVATVKTILRTGRNMRVFSFLQHPFRLWGPPNFLHLVTGCHKWRKIYLFYA